jgi:hypothetical protein
MYNIAITSTFESTVNSSVTGSNLRKLQAKYEMLVPDYNDVYTENYIGDLNQYLVFDNRALVIGGNMEIDNANVNVSGNIFVQGNEEEIEDKVYDKYKGGITLNSSDNITFEDNVITRGTFNIQNDTTATITGELYARNIYAGKLDGDYSDSSNLTIDKVITDSDLALKATNTNITINDFYGINDKNIYYNDELGNEIENKDSNPNDKSRTSSSIIINGYTGEDKLPSSVNITNLAYIMGTAHIATADNYQTGESVAVKGNYIAYSIPLDDSEKFIYDDPLQLLDEDNIFKKAEHFNKYWNEKSDKTADDGGISLPEGNTHSVGAVVYKSGGITTVIPSNYELKDTTDVITEKQINYASEVYEFGEDSDITDYNSLGEDAMTVENLMDFSDVPSDYSLDDEISSGGEMAIFNLDDAKTIVIKGKNHRDSYTDTDKYIIIDASDNKEVNAVIATMGNIIVDGDINFNGSIIANGNLNIYGDVAIKYNKELIKRIQIQNIDLFNNVLGDYIIESTEDTSTSTSTTDTVDAEYDLKNFIKSKLWKIIK